MFGARLRSLELMTAMERAPTEQRATRSASAVSIGISPHRMRGNTRPERRVMMRCEDEGVTSVDQGIINLSDHSTHGGMSRREFLDRLAELAGSTAAAVALLPLLQNNYAQAAIVAAGDARARAASR